MQDGVPELVSEGHLYQKKYRRKLYLQTTFSPILDCLLCQGVAVFVQDGVPELVSEGHLYQKKYRRKLYLQTTFSPILDCLLCQSYGVPQITSGYLCKERRQKRQTSRCLWKKRKLPIQHAYTTYSLMRGRIKGPRPLVNPIQSDKTFITWVIKILHGNGAPKATNLRLATRMSLPRSKSLHCHCI